MKASRFYLEIINHLTDGVYFVDRDRTIRFWNKAAEQITGYRAEEVVGKHCQDSMLHHIDCEGRPLCTLGCPLFQTLQDGESRTDQVLVRHKAGYRISIHISIFPIREEDRVVGAVEIFARNSAQVFEDDFISRMADVAMHDPLTRLPNRRYTESFLSYKIQECGRFHQNVAVLFADTDDFRTFNNTYGHDAGDAVLKNIAASITRNIRKSDMVSRWGGEEFLGMYTAEKPEHAAVVGEKFRSLVECTDIVRGDQILRTTSSVGVTLLRADDDLDSVIKRADQLMYHSKLTGKNRVTLG